MGYAASLLILDNRDGSLRWHAEPAESSTRSDRAGSRLEFGPSSDRVIEVPPAGTSVIPNPTSETPVQWSARPGTRSLGRP
jgi:hypothetical protein